MKRRRNRSNRVKVSFAATVLVLTLVTVSVYVLSFRTPTYSIPSNLQPYRGAVGVYAPSDSLAVTFDNLTAIRSYNSSAVPDRDLVRLVEPQLTVKVADVQSKVIITILNKSIGVNNSATVAILSEAAFANVTQAFAHTNLTRIQDLGFSLYNVTDKANGPTKRELFTFLPSDSAVIFSPLGTDARATVSQVLSVRVGALPSILSDGNVTRMIYAAGGIDHLALAIQKFRGEVLTGVMGLVAVDVVGGQVQVTHIVGFASSDFAASQVSQVKAVFRYASEFAQYEEFVRADEKFNFSNLQGAINLAGE